MGSISAFATTIRIWQRAQCNSQADRHTLPFQPVFDVTFCHFLLLWVSNPEKVVAEMGRVTRPGGSVRLAEPDYGGRIDYPESLSLYSAGGKRIAKRTGR
jgi:SAM-dependent methyltransferase